MLARSEVPWIPSVLARQRGDRVYLYPLRCVPSDLYSAYPLGTHVHALARPLPLQHAPRQLTFASYKPWSPLAAMATRLNARLGLLLLLLLQLLLALVPVPVLPLLRLPLLLLLLLLLLPPVPR